jgi:RHS repeat-associated protein
LQKKCAGGYRYDYQGQYSEKDPVTGLNNFELRMYDPMIGRWLTTDPQGQYYSPYERMGNNPVSGTDPTGEEADWHRDFLGSLVADVGDNSQTLSSYLNIGLGDASNIILNDCNWDYGNSGGVSSDGITGHILSGGLDNLNVLPSPMNVGELNNYQDFILLFEGSLAGQGRSRMEGTLAIVGSDGKDKTLYWAVSGSGTPKPIQEYDNWNVANLRIKEPPFYHNGVGFSLEITPDPYLNRRSLRIHPADPRRGTLGCIGLICSKEQLIDFENRIRTYLQSHGVIKLIVNCGHPNF